MTKKITIEELMPEDTPNYMFDAWISCMSWAAKNDEIRAKFHKFFKNTVLTDDEFIEVFIPWFNENIWGKEKICLKQSSSIGDF